MQLISLYFLRIFPMSSELMQFVSYTVGLYIKQMTRSAEERRN